MIRQYDIRSTMMVSDTKDHAPKDTQFFTLWLVGPRTHSDVPVV